MEIKLFVSSTFIDFQLEREWLHKEVFPKILKNCSQKNVKFQVVDLRWGVSTEAVLDQNTLDICLNELKHCKAVSAYPFMLTLLGNRYGWRPLPRIVEESIFENWCVGLPDEERALLVEWYHLDKNQLPVSYILKPRSDEYENDNAWNKVESSLRDIIDRISNSDPEHKHMFGMSATHHEISEGILEKGAENTLVVHRRLNENNEVPNYFSDSGPHRLEQQNLIEEVYSQTPSECFYALEAEWKSHSLSDDYKEKFINLVSTRLTDALEELSKKALPNYTMEEQHASFRSRILSDYKERPSSEKSLQAHLAPNLSTPKVLVGASGTGKTHLLTKVASRTSSFSTIRYIGLNAESARCSSVILSLISELEREFQFKSQVKLGASINERFNEALKSLPDTVEVSIFIDAVDRQQLKAGEPWFDWLPLTLPENVSILLSTTYGDNYNKLSRLLPQSAFLTIDRLETDDACAMLKQWLTPMDRQLQPNQVDYLLNSAASHPAPPLFLKVMSSSARYWHHGFVPTALLTTNDALVRDCLSILADVLHHGQAFVTTIFGLIASSELGIPEDHLWDVLNCSKAVRQEYERRYPLSPKSEDLPRILWSRLRLDTQQIIQEFVENEQRVLRFSHHQFREQTLKILGQEQAHSMHQALADIYLNSDKFQFWYEDLSEPNHYLLKALPWHLIRLNDTGSLAKLLADFNFLVAKCAAAQTDDLLYLFEQTIKTKNSDVVLTKLYRHIQNVASFSNSATPCHKTLVQLSFEQAPRHPAKELVHHWLKAGHCNWNWIGSNTPTSLLDSKMVLSENLAEISEICMVDSNTVALAAKDNVIRITNIKTGRQLTSLVGHNAKISCLVADSDNHLISASTDNTLIIWDLQTGRELRKTKLPESPTNIFLDSENRIILQNLTKLTSYSFELETLQNNEFSPEELISSSVLSMSHSQSLLVNIQNDHCKKLSQKDINFDGVGQTFDCLFWHKNQIYRFPQDVESPVSLRSSIEGNISGIADGLGDELVVWTHEGGLYRIDINTGTIYKHIQFKEPVLTVRVNSSQTLLMLAKRTLHIDYMSFEIVNHFRNVERYPSLSICSLTKAGDSTRRIFFAGMFEHESMLCCWSIEGAKFFSLDTLDERLSIPLEDEISNIQPINKNQCFVCTRHNSLYWWTLSDNSISLFLEGGEFSGFNHLDENHYFWWCSQTAETLTETVNYRILSKKDLSSVSAGEIEIGKSSHFFRAASSSLYREIIPLSGENLLLITMESIQELDLNQRTVKTKSLFNRQINIARCIKLNTTILMLFDHNGKVYLYDIERTKIFAEPSAWFGEVEPEETVCFNDTDVFLKPENGKPFLLNYALFISEIEDILNVSSHLSICNDFEAFGDQSVARLTVHEWPVEHLTIYHPSIAHGQIKQSAHNLGFHDQRLSTEKQFTQLKKFGDLLLTWGDDGVVALRNRLEESALTSIALDPLSIKQVLIPDDIELYTSPGFDNDLPYCVIVHTDKGLYQWMPLMDYMVTYNVPHSITFVGYQQERLAVTGDNYLSILSTSPFYCGINEPIVHHNFKELEEQHNLLLVECFPLPASGFICIFIDNKSYQHHLCIQSEDQGSVRRFFKLPFEGILFPVMDSGMAIIDKEAGTFGFYDYVGEQVQHIELESPVRAITTVKPDVVVIATNDGPFRLKLKQIVDPDTGKTFTKIVNEGIYGALTNVDEKVIRWDSHGLLITPSRRFSDPKRIDWVHDSKVKKAQLTTLGNLLVLNENNVLLTLQAFIGNNPVSIHHMEHEKGNQYADLLRHLLIECNQLINGYYLQHAYTVFQQAGNLIEVVRKKQLPLPNELTVQYYLCHILIRLWTTIDIEEIQSLLIRGQNTLEQMDDWQSNSVFAGVYHHYFVLSQFLKFPEIKWQELTEAVDAHKQNGHEESYDYDDLLLEMMSLVRERLFAGINKAPRPVISHLLAVLKKVKILGEQFTENQQFWVFQYNLLNSTVNAKLEESRENANVVQDDSLIDVTKITLPEEFSELHQKALSGDAEAWLDLGVLWGQGVRVTKNLKYAEACYVKSAALGNSLAAMNLSQMYRIGDGVPKNHDKFIKYLRQAAENGHVPAQANLGSAYLKSEASNENTWNDAVFWLKKAAQSGDELAELNLALAYTVMAPDGMADLQKAIDYLTIPLAKGNANATKILNLIKTSFDL